VRGCLIVPIFEEVFFRGVLLSWLRSRLNVHVAPGDCRHAGAQLSGSAGCGQLT
jgi:hypothetical protein